MTSATERLEKATLARATFNEARPLVVRGRLWRGALVVGDLLWLVAIAFSIPFVILAIGLPIALCARLLVWVGSRL